MLPTVRSGLVSCVQLLETLGYTVYSAQSGEQAIEIYKEKQGQVDLVILDMIMPGTGGGETFDALRRMNPELKILLSSGYSMEGQAREIMDRECNGFIQKPFDMGEISEKIQNILNP